MIINIKQVSEIVGFKTSNIYKLMNDGTFPPQIKFTPKSVGWLESEVKQYVYACACGKRGDDLRAVIKGMIEKRDEEFRAMS